MGHIERIFIASVVDTDIQAVDAIQAVAGRGLRKDRHFFDRPSQTQVDNGDRARWFDVTLVEREAIESVEREMNTTLPPGAHGFNIVTVEMTLSELENRLFRVGEVLCCGIGREQFHRQLQQLTHNPPDDLLSRGALGARIIQTGIVRQGDSLILLD